jgi:transketolase
MKATRESYGEALVDLGEKYKDIVVLDADLAEATKTINFKNKFPDRFFDMGIAEQDMMGTAAGLALGGKIPFASTFAIFAAGRAYDQVRNGICYSNLNVKIAATHAGITVGEDGASHQAIEDIALMRVIPNLIILSPSDDVQTKYLVEEAVKYKGPVYIRLARPKTEEIYQEETRFEIGKAVCHGEGEDGTVIATGVTVIEALKAQEMLKEQGINIRVLDMHTI